MKPALPPGLRSATTMDMAEGQSPNTYEGKSPDSKEEEKEDVMETCRKNLEAAKQTLRAFDALDRRWQVCVCVCMCVGGFACMWACLYVNWCTQMYKIDPIFFLSPSNNVGCAAEVRRHPKNLTSNCIQSRGNMHSQHWWTICCAWRKTRHRWNL